MQEVDLCQAIDQVDVRREGNDAVLSGLDTTDFGELWLFAVDTGNGLTAQIVRALRSFDKEAVGF